MVGRPYSNNRTSPRSFAQVFWFFGAVASAVPIGASQEPVQQDDKSGRLYYAASGEKLYDRGVQHVSQAPIDVKLCVTDIREYRRSSTRASRWPAGRSPVRPEMNPVPSACEAD
eukprot:3162087-Amphidinium_carterae.1